MKKNIKIISILLIFSIIFIELSNVVIVIKFGHGHEITIGESRVTNPSQNNSIKKMNPASVVKGKLYTLFNTEPTRKHMDVSYISSIKQLPGNKYLTPFLFGQLFTTALPKTILTQRHGSDDSFDHQINPIISFNQDYESSYAFQQQLKYDIQLIMDQSGRKKSEFIERNTDLLQSDQTEFNIAEIQQSGNSNLAYQQQHGMMNVALIQQVGITNIAIQTQNGALNIAKTFQSGLINVCVQNQRSSINNAEVIQSGILNNAIQTQNVELQGGSNNASTNQEGIFNSSRQNQNGTLNKANSIQSGIGNVSEQHQYGNLNDALTAQTSFGCVAIQSQNSGLSGSNTLNKAEIYQSDGSGNSAEQIQTNIGGDVFLNNAVTRQKGYSNSASQTQTGGNNFCSISQTGNNNNSNVYQIKL